MQRSALFALTAAMLACMPAAALAQESERGKTLARDVCSNCHDIGDGIDRVMTVGAPSFVWIAQNRKPGEIEAKMIRPGHPDMPEAPLTVADRQHLLAYIVSLAGEAAQQGDP